MRYKITVRGQGVELRGRFDEPTDEDASTLRYFAEQMEPFGIVVASPAEDDFDPFAIDQPEHPPTLENSIDVLTGIAASSTGLVEVIERFAAVHHAQAQIIRMERGRRMQLEKELLSRELHHFETEQIVDRIKQYVKANEADGDGMVDASDILAFIGSTA
jgi:hypothetical protein